MKDFTFILSLFLFSLSLNGQVDSTEFLYLSDTIASEKSFASRRIDAPQFNVKFDESQQKNKKGKIVLKVCVNSEGKVTSANYQKTGSTSKDQDLITIAKENAFKWRFSKSEKELQCGTITYEFKSKQD